MMADIINLYCNVCPNKSDASNLCNFITENIDKSIFKLLILSFDIICFRYWTNWMLKIKHFFINCMKKTKLCNLTSNQNGKMTTLIGMPPFLRICGDLIFHDSSFSFKIFVKVFYVAL